MRIPIDVLVLKGDEINLQAKLISRVLVIVRRAF